MSLWLSAAGIPLVPKLSVGRQRAPSKCMLLRLIAKLTLFPTLVIVAVLSGACGSSQSQSPNSTKESARLQAKQPGYITDPTCCGLRTAGNKGIESAWRTFTNDGRYRLALKDDFRATARAFGADDPLNSIFAYCWGRLGYDSHPDRWYHLAAIVVDTHHSGDDRFGLVIFSAPKDGDGSYQPYWLFRELDLSGMVVWTGSGDLMVAQYRDDGSRGASFIHWDRRRKQYIATTSRPRPT